ncbi:MAG: CDP-alcohol phosphatidyltransferase family protein [Magnetococcales bacterium]|nr:CDP-alcohol phosphatidyltransferase family protein [Magnetococcales bacterium]
MNLPNALSFLRILAVPGFVWLLVSARVEAAFWLFIAAGLTDALDGYLAKQYNLVTELGSYLDPLADKLLLVAGFITLSYLDWMPLWLTFMVVTRDIIIIGGAIVFLMLTSSLRMEPLWISKVNTFVQIALLTSTLLCMAHDLSEDLLKPLIWITVATTMSSGGMYIMEWTRRATAAERGQSDGES